MSCTEDTVDFEETGAISGTVLDEIEQLPVANAEISTNPSSSTVFTNSDGEFFINNIVVGSYAVQADAPGFDTDFEAVTVTPDNVSSVAFQLLRDDTNNLPPSVPTLIFPEDGANDIDVQVELQWIANDPENDPLEYIVELRNGTTSEIETFEAITDSSLVVTDLDLSTSYFWQVSVTDQENATVSSPIRQFTTLESPSNEILFVRSEGNNNVIFSGGEADGSINVNLLQLTSENTNSFNPRKNNDISRIAFLRTVSGESQLFTMDLAGEDILQLSDAIPVSGFRENSLRFTWFNNGQQILYPNFNRLVSVNNDGSGTTILLELNDGSLISEIAVTDFNSDLIVLKTNNTQGYDVRIFTFRLSTGEIEDVILEDTLGAAGGIDISANGDEVLFFRDVSGSENEEYRIFDGRLFLYNTEMATTTFIDTGFNGGFNNLQPSFLPNEGGVIFTRVESQETNGSSSVFTRIFDDAVQQSRELFSDAFMPDWE